MSIQFYYVSVYEFMCLWGTYRIIRKFYKELIYSTGKNSQLNFHKRVFFGKLLGKFKENLSTTHTWNKKETYSYIFFFCVNYYYCKVFVFKFGLLIFFFRIAGNVLGL
jgi:hypothetical protein